MRCSPLSPTDFPLNSAGTIEPLERKELIPALVGAGMCLFFARIGFFAFFFLLPLGFLAFRYGHRIVWNALFFAVTGNALILLGTALSRGAPLTGTFWNVFYFAGMTSVFVWITAPPSGLPFKASGTARLVIGSCAASLLFIGMFFRVAASPAFLEQLGAITNAVVARQSAPSSDVVRAALLAEITPEMVLAFMTAIVLRGGALFFSVFLFFSCRQASFFLVRLFTRNKQAVENQLAVFHVPPVTIWMFSGSLLLVVLTSAANILVLEILLWNILAICVILYLAQGFGILQFFLGRLAVTPFLRLLLLASFFVLLFSPGINAVLLGGVVLLGIAEIWVPLRAPKTNGPPSTPEAK